MLDSANPEHRGIEERLGSEIVIWLTTVDGDGQPQPSPVWFLWDGEGFLIYSRPGSHKVGNIRANPRVGLNLRGTETGEDITVFEGTASIQPDAPTPDSLAPYVEKYRDSMRDEGWTPEQFAELYSLPIRINPTRLRAW